MKKITDLFRKTPPPTPVPENPNPELGFPVFDIAQSASVINLSALEVLTWAPVWMLPAERLLLFTMAFGLRPQRYLEIGTLHGGSALIVHAAMEAHQTNGRIVCLDPRPQIAPEHWQRLSSRATLIQGFSPDALPQAEAAAGGKFDLVLIDGDHSYAGAMRDAKGILPYVAEGAYVLFHDSLYFEVMRAVDDFVLQHPGQVVDFGTLTREASFVAEPNQPAVRWGGLRMVQVRRTVTAH